MDKFDFKAILAAHYEDTVDENGKVISTRLVDIVCDRIEEDKPVTGGGLLDLIVPC